jgi:hypothetical protein
MNKLMIASSPLKTNNILMKKSFLILYALMGFLMLHSCSKKQKESASKPLKTAHHEAYNAYFTQDHEGNAVLCWTEKDNKDSLYRLKYAIFDSAADSFAAPVIVPGSAGMTAVAESMGKIAFKADGTVMAMFGKRFVKEKNPYAGAIYYTYSKDKGKSWTQNQFLHRDTTHQYGRSFFDLKTLKDGELAAVWLDGRFGKALKGSALYFARTERRNGFTSERCLGKGTCECCRTSLLQDDHGNIHIAYRNIMFPAKLIGKQVRDIAYIYSKDNGHSFSAPITVSEDNWQIDGCPHSGPSLAVTGKTVNGAWFTAGGTPGVYYTKTEMGSAFKKRTLISSEARHPQMLALPKGKLAIVFEENWQSDPQGGHKRDPAHGNSSKSHQHAGMNMNHQPAGLSKIVLSVLKDGYEERKIMITDGEHADHHAVVSPLKDGVLIAWTREQHGKSGIFYRKMSLPEYD